MGLFDLFRKRPDPKPEPPQNGPYQDSAVNQIYNLLFCDDPELYKTNTETPYSYPFDVLYSEIISAEDLQKITGDPGVDARVRVLAYNRLREIGQGSGKKELLGVIVEIGLDHGQDTLASFVNGTARYINQSGKVIIWETTDDPISNELTGHLFARSRPIVDRIGPWDKPRRPHPEKGSARISFLVSDGLYFGEGPMDVFFNDPMAGPALGSAAQLMGYLVEKSLSAGK